MRVHQVKVATATISRICGDLGLPCLQRPKRRRAGPQLRLFEKATLGEAVQVDVKVVKLGPTRAYQYTACDDCTRFRVLRLYRQQNTFASLDFLSQIVAAFPFPIRKLQTDNGSEFSFTFIAVERRGIRHRYIKPGRPDQKSYVAYAPH
jgi:transposase InsO family protein